MGSKPPKIRCNCFHYHHRRKPNSLGLGLGDNNGGGGYDNGSDYEDNDGCDNDNVQNECNQCVGTTTLLCRLALMQMSF